MRRRPRLLAVVMLLPLLSARMPGKPTALVVELLPVSSGASLATLTPLVSITAVDPDGLTSASVFGLQIATSELFEEGIVLDTFVLASADSIAIQLQSPLPSGATVYLRAYARDESGQQFLSETSPPFLVPFWLLLRFPNEPSGNTLFSRSPTFRWSSAPVLEPPGPWSYRMDIRTSSSGALVFSSDLADTVLALPVELDVNTSYRWSVMATLLTGASITVGSASTFIVASTGEPRVTLLYQNFPNPFPSSTTDVTCIWFDLHEPAPAVLDVLDIRGNPVRRIFPPAGGAGSILSRGRHGRKSESGTGCSDEFTWDGRDDLGRLVGAGVYILRLRTRKSTFTKRMVFSGR